MILPSYYLPPVSYVAALYQATMRGEPVFVDETGRWEKQTLRSRCFIDGPNGRQMLGVPVAHNGAKTMDAVVLSDHGNWRHQHAQALVSAYENSPYFEYFWDDFKPHYEPERHLRLVDFNRALLETVLGLLEIPVPERAEEGMPTELTNAKFQPYAQVFSHRHPFIENLSVADLLFNMGMESRLILKNTVFGD